MKDEERSEPFSHPTRRRDKDHRTAEAVEKGEKKTLSTYILIITVHHNTQQDTTPLTMCCSVKSSPSTGQMSLQPIANACRTPRE